MENNTALKHKSQRSLIGSTSLFFFLTVAQNNTDVERIEREREADGESRRWTSRVSVSTASAAAALTGVSPPPPSLNPPPSEAPPTPLTGGHHKRVRCPKLP
ncbi:hypothetical protein EYF80_044840 [Liparis tanakae]|uniref:Uncharacterized protein n=1 Tax=Liparis tanakae TaxID=230148 RepID=A0A4Z2FUP4_9TELE|nr:hypothetical protein EYF80_044840 [Liparis tanakae]